MLSSIRCSCDDTYLPRTCVLSTEHTGSWATVLIENQFTIDSSGKLSILCPLMESICSICTADFIMRTNYGTNNVVFWIYVQFRFSRFLYHWFLCSLALAKHQLLPKYCSNSKFTSCPSSLKVYLCGLWTASNPTLQKVLHLSRDARECTYIQRYVRPCLCAEYSQAANVSQLAVIVLILPLLPVVFWCYSLCPTCFPVSVFHWFLAPCVVMSWLVIC